MFYYLGSALSWFRDELLQFRILLPLGTEFGREVRVRYFQHIGDPVQALPD